MRQSQLRKLIKESIREAFVDKGGNLQDFSFDNDNDPIQGMRDLAQNLGSHPNIVKKYGNEDNISGHTIFNAVMGVVRKVESEGDLPSEPGFDAEAIRESIKMYFEEEGLEDQNWTPEEAYEIISYSLEMMGTGAESNYAPSAEQLLSYIIY